MLQQPKLIVATASVFVTLIVVITVLAVLAGGNEAPPPDQWNLSQRTTDTTADSEPTVRYVPYNGLPTSAADDGAARAQRGPSAPTEPVVELPTLSDVLQDPYDESKLIHGSDGAEGSILPLDNGVVPSSGPRFHTDWELILPSAGIRAAVVRVGLTPDRSMGATDNPFVIGWFHRSAIPGEAGNALLGGHRDYRDRDGNVGFGVCWELDEARVGDQLIMHDQSANRYYVYDIVDTVSLHADSEEAKTYLRQTRESVVTLITCTGEFDGATNSYDSRIIVVALLDAVATPDA